MGKDEMHRSNRVTSIWPLPLSDCSVAEIRSEYKLHS